MAGNAYGKLVSISTTLSFEARVFSQRLSLCEVVILRNLRNQHAAGKRHLRQVANGRSQGREPNNLEVSSSPEYEDWDPCPPGMSTYDFDQLDDLRAVPEAPVDSEDVTKVGYARRVVETAQQEVVDHEGVAESAALGMRKAMLTSLTDLVPAKVQLHSVASGSFTKLTAGVVLGHVSCWFVVGVEEGLMRLYINCTVFRRGDKSTAWGVQPPHIAALAHLAPHAFNSCATTLSVRSEQAQGSAQALCLSTAVHKAA